MIVMVVSDSPSNLVYCYLSESAVIGLDPVSRLLTCLPATDWLMVNKLDPKPVSYPVQNT